MWLILAGIATDYPKLAFGDLISRSKMQRKSYRPFSQTTLYTNSRRNLPNNRRWRKFRVGCGEANAVWRGDKRCGADNLYVEDCYPYLLNLKVNEHLRRCVYRHR